jgi:hypothetical protein
VRVFTIIITTTTTRLSTYSSLKHPNFYLRLTLSLLRANQEKRCLSLAARLVRNARRPRTR